MKLLLDTHVFLWAALEPMKLAKSCRIEIEDPANEVRVSVITAWEISIKQSLGKLLLADVAEQWVPNVIAKSGFSVAAVDLNDALRVRGLPWHHRDPFDRLLIAQAASRGYTIVTHDRIFAKYGVGVLPASS